jgi:hypothetical protein
MISIFQALAYGRKVGRSLVSAIDFDIWKAMLDEARYQNNPKLVDIMLRLNQAALTWSKAEKASDYEIVANLFFKSFLGSGGIIGVRGIIKKRQKKLVEALLVVPDVPKSTLRTIKSQFGWELKQSSDNLVDYLSVMFYATFPKWRNELAHYFTGSTAEDIIHDPLLLQDVLETLSGTNLEAHQGMQEELWIHVVGHASGPGFSHPEKVNMMLRLDAAAQKVMDDWRSQLSSPSAVEFLEDFVPEFDDNYSEYEIGAVALFQAYESRTLKELAIPPQASSPLLTTVISITKRISHVRQEDLCEIQRRTGIPMGFEL